MKCLFVSDHPKNRDVSRSPPQHVEIEVRSSRILGSSTSMMHFLLLPPSRRISLLHLAVCRGSDAMVQALRPIMKSAHQRPVAASKREPINALPWQDVAKTMPKSNKQDHGKKVGRGWIQFMMVPCNCDTGQCFVAMTTFSETTRRHLYL